MNAVELIRKKREGDVLSEKEINFFFTSYLKGTVPDYQVSAMLMAIYFQSLSHHEMTSLCKLMIESGRVVNLSSIHRPKIDKHSTGGVGDKTSLILAPIVASLGVAVPMISGRGLGHTGGTLDKLESIPGFKINLREKKFIQVLAKHHCALIGQTKEIAPLDKLLYALRDVTGTVESIPLIASSIMSKKIASGLDGLVLDVKTGKGAFMQSKASSIKLAKTLIAIGESYGKKVSAFITAMDDPLGYSIGNWLEVKECIECLQGRNDKLVSDTVEVTLTLAGEMLMLANKARSLEEGIALAQKQIDNGRAFKKFIDVAKAQGAMINVILNPARYPQSKFSESVYASKNGFITGLNAFEIGMNAVLLGAGRITKEESIESKAGIVFSKKVGDNVRAGELIALIHTDKKNAVDKVKAGIENAIQISSSKAKLKSKILSVIR